MDQNTDKKTDKRLANLKPAWKEGESGNKDGRPKGQRNFATIYREALIKIATLNGKEPDELEIEIVSNALLSARKGDYRFYKDVHDRLHGTATVRTESKVELSGTIDAADPRAREIADRYEEELKKTL